MPELASASNAEPSQGLEADGELVGGWHGIAREGGLASPGVDAQPYPDELPAVDELAKRTADLVREPNPADKF